MVHNDKALVDEEECNASGLKLTVPERTRSFAV